MLGAPFGRRRAVDDQPLPAPLPRRRRRGHERWLGREDRLRTQRGRRHGPAARAQLRHVLPAGDAAEPRDGHSPRQAHGARGHVGPVGMEPGAVPARVRRTQGGGRVDARDELPVQPQLEDLLPLHPRGQRATARVHAALDPHQLPPREARPDEGRAPLLLRQVRHPREGHLAVERRRGHEAAHRVQEDQPERAPRPRRRRRRARARQEA
mmetsp:Transcript_2802/g.6996  ORF Transcript_2802/g.6996 Transcript_2802/m.6996 type:complete len:210 (+) Transcript_2802:1182-1811(+)